MQNEEKLPESVGKTREELTAAEKFAIVYLGFYAYEDYGKIFEHTFRKFSHDVY